MDAPFWKSEVMDRESVFFVKDEGAGEASASLLLPPRRILCVARADGQLAYDAGRDYALDAAAGTLRLTPGSRIPFKTAAEMFPEKGAPQSIGETRDGKRHLFWSEGHLFHDLQTVVTYEPASRWRGWVPKFSGASLPHTMRRLGEEREFRLAAIGDSITAGWNASGYTLAPPYQPPYPGLVAYGLSARFPARVVLNNFAVPGKSSPWGVENIGPVAAWKPDLVLQAFGQADTWSAPLETYARCSRRMMDAVREENPDAEFVLVASMLGNRDWHPGYERFPAFRDALAALCGPGAVLADMTAVWTEMLKRKRFADVTGNGVNHPNDFGHRLYAQVILALVAGDGD